MPSPNNPYTWKNLFINIGFYCGFILLNVAIFVLSPPAYIILKYAGGYTSGQAVRRIIWFYGRGWTLLISCFMPFQIDTKMKEDYPKPCIILVNHQSFFDAFCMGSLPIYDVVFAVRAWPFRIPFYGPYMRSAGYLNSENMTYEDFLKSAGAMLQQGVSLIIFPEGTRSRTGELGRFYSGAFKLAMDEGVPVVPLCLQGTGAFLPKGKAWVRAASISAKTLAPLDPREFEKFGEQAHIELRKAVKKIYVQELGQSDRIS